MNWRLYNRLLLLALGLTALVIVLGVFTRLSDAGLGCPDWPGCYGHLLSPMSDQEIAQAKVRYPWRPVEISKAIKEMVHRYFAGSLVILVFILVWQALRHRHDRGVPVRLSLVLCGLILFQAVLGMWTVTWRLQPLVVVAHLLCGFTTLVLLWLMLLRTGYVSIAKTSDGRYFFWAVGGLVLLVIQIALGGWMSANYAALACSDFPTCQKQWWPDMDWLQGFILWRGIGPDYEFGTLESPARTAIHMAHRLGALFIFIYLFGLMVSLMKSGTSVVVKKTAGIVMVLLLLQLLLGIGNVVFALPMLVAIAHNIVAALLLLAMVTVVDAMAYSDSKPIGGFFS